MSPQPDQDNQRSVLSWQSVLDAEDSESSRTGNADDHSAAEIPVDDASAPTPPPPATAADAGIELTIAPLSLDPLSLDPLPPISDGVGPNGGASVDRADVLGDVHFELAPLDLDEPARAPGPAPVPATPAPAPAPAVVHAPAPAPAPAPALPLVAADPTPAVSAPDPDMLGLTIAPLDVPDMSPSGQVRTVETDLAAPAPAAPEPTRPDAFQPAPTEAPASSPSADVQAAPVPQTPPTSDPAMAQPAPGVSSLPADTVPNDDTPTTVIAATSVSPAPSPVAQPALPEIPVPKVPSLQQDQSGGPQLATATTPTNSAPSPTSRKDQRHQAKMRKAQQKAALKQAKSAGGGSGAGGIALFFTLLVLVGLIAGGIIYGQPYLFPDEWDDAARPYGEAVETARGSEFSDPVLIQRRASDVFAAAMTAQVVGPWESQMPTWRSLGLISGAMDAPLLQRLVENWNAAYYAPITGEVIANDAAGPAVLDAALAEAMAAAAIDQETGWASTIDDSLLEAPALTRAIVTASSRTAAAATVFGAADNSVRDIAVSTFLPPVLEYRVNAPLAYAEFFTDAPDERSADFDALRTASLLQPSSVPELAVGDTSTATRSTDRTFWYLVFASYADPATAYSASNDLVQASLTTADSAGRQCTYGTFSGTDVDGTARLSNILQQWVDTVPPEMTASLSTMADGTMQLRTCDPGADFASGARFGLGREIARFRTVELAALAAIPATEAATVDRAAVIEQVRDAQVALPMVELPFDATFAASADAARAIVAAGIPVPATPGG